MLYNDHRPKRFADVVGQESEVAVIRSVIEKGWRPAFIMLSGPYGTGKTTLARLISRALLCEGRTEMEPCGVCKSCKAMDSDSHPAYTEIDSASNGLIADVREMKDDALYRVPGGKIRILVYDESHMISVPGQNALLQILEEGREGLLFIMCTTDPEKMVPTIRSRCVDLNLRLLTAAEVYSRLKVIADTERMEYEEKALRVIATYVRGHVRDSIVLLEQVHQMAGAVKEDAVRAHLRLDRMVEIYELLTKLDPREGIPVLEGLLCVYAAGELVNNTAQILLDSYKLYLKIAEFGQVDTAWMQKIITAQGANSLLEKAEKLLMLETDFSGIAYGVAAMGRILFDGTVSESMASRRLEPGSVVPSIAAHFRKPGR